MDLSNKKLGFIRSIKKEHSNNSPSAIFSHALDIEPTQSNSNPEHQTPYKLQEKLDKMITNIQSITRSSTNNNNDHIQGYYEEIDKCNSELMELKSYLNKHNQSENDLKKFNEHIQRLSNDIQNQHKFIDENDKSKKSSKNVQTTNKNNEINVDKFKSDQNQKMQQSSLDLAWDKIENQNPPKSYRYKNGTKNLINEMDKENYNDDESTFKDIQHEKLVLEKELAEINEQERQFSSRSKKSKNQLDDLPKDDNDLKIKTQRDNFLEEMETEWDKIQSKKYINKSDLNFKYENKKNPSVDQKLERVQAMRQDLSSTLDNWRNHDARSSIFSLRSADVNANLSNNKQSFLKQTKDNEQNAFNTLKSQTSNLSSMYNRTESNFVHKPLNFLNREKESKINRDQRENEEMRGLSRLASPINNTASPTPNTSFQMIFNKNPLIQEQNYIFDKSPLDQLPNEKNNFFEKSPLNKSPFDKNPYEKNNFLDKSPLEKTPNKIQSPNFKFQLNTSKSPARLNLIDVNENITRIQTNISSAKSPVNANKTLNQSQVDESKINVSDFNGSPASKLRNVQLKVSRTSDQENLRNINKISSEMKNKTNFLDEVNNWRLQASNTKHTSNNNKFKDSFLQTAPLESNSSVKPQIPKSTTFKELNELNIMKQKKSTDTPVQNIDDAFKPLMNRASSYSRLSNFNNESKFKNKVETERGQVSSISQTNKQTSKNRVETPLSNSQNKPSSNDKSDKYDGSWINDYKRQLKSRKSLTYRNDESKSSFIINKLTKNLTNAEGYSELNQKNSSLINDSVELGNNQRDINQIIEDFESKSKNQRSTSSKRNNQIDFASGSPENDGLKFKSDKKLFDSSNKKGQILINDLSLESEHTYAKIKSDEKQFKTNTPSFKSNNLLKDSHSSEQLTFNSNDKKYVEKNPTMNRGIVKENDMKKDSSKSISINDLKQNIQKAREQYNKINRDNNNQKENFKMQDPKVDLKVISPNKDDKKQQNVRFSKFNETIEEQLPQRNYSNNKLEPGNITKKPSFDSSFEDINNSGNKSSELYQKNQLKLNSNNQLTKENIQNIKKEVENDFSKFDISDFNTCIQNLREESKLIKERKSNLNWSQDINVEDKNVSYVKNSSFIIDKNSGLLEYDSIFKD